MRAVVIYSGLLVCLSLTVSVRANNSANARSSDTSKAWLLHLPGISGETGLDKGMIRGLRDGGYDGTVEVYDWTAPNPGLPALMAANRNHEQALKIADKITERFRTQPDGQILIVSHSAGTGLCVWALEDLAEDVKVNSVLLLSSALSPNYDLTRALSHVTGRAYAFSSPNDIVVGTGTQLFGTVDGKRTIAAGHAGFSQPETGDRAQYEKLISKPYDPAWMKLGNIGDHVGMMIPTFDSAVLSPLLLASLPKTHVSAHASSTSRPISAGQAHAHATSRPSSY